MAAVDNALTARALRMILGGEKKAEDMTREAQGALFEVIVAAAYDAESEIARALWEVFPYAINDRFLDDLLCEDTAGMIHLLRHGTFLHAVSDLLADMSEHRMNEGEFNPRPNAFDLMRCKFINSALSNRTIQRAGARYTWLLDVIAKFE